jgi:3',5'-cyclic-AMP phosphodiesterase
MSFRLAWATDVHFEFCDGDVIDAFVASVVAAESDALLLTGDIGQAPSVCGYLDHLAQALSLPVYVILGNHDFYKGSVADVRAAVSAYCRESKMVRWLRDTSAVSLTPKTALVGVDGWGDGRLGDYAGSDVVLTDSVLIRELAGLDSDALLQIMQTLADDDAAILRRSLEAVPAAASQVIVATHVPPFAAAAWHEGEQSSDHWLPFFSCKAVGDVIVEAAERRPSQELLVLCGHTHGGGEIAVRTNLRVLTGPAEYGVPRLQRVFEVP